MKRFCILLFVAIALVACEKENESVIRNTDLQEVVAQNKVSLKEALLYAENSVNGIDPTTRSAERKVKSTEIYVAKPATRSAEDTEVSFYLINYEDNEGFAMVSTDSRTTPVYAYADKGNITVNDIETNPGLRLYMIEAIANYESEVANSDDDVIFPIEIPDSLDGHIVTIDGVDCYSKTDDVRDIIMGPYLTVEWHQEAPYNYYCGNPYYATGCGPTAMAQIMSLYRHPQSHNGYTYDWDSMVAVSGFSSNDTSIGALSTAKLMYDIGIASKAEHSVITETHPHDNMAAFREFDYNCSDVIYYDRNTIINELNNGRPIFAGGYTFIEGHAWVIDGYEKKHSVTKYYVAAPPYQLHKTVHNYSDITYYFHCNMGLKDNENIFLLETEFKYKYDKVIIYQIYPN